MSRIMARRMKAVVAMINASLAKDPLLYGLSAVPVGTYVATIFFSSL
jgi:hypothetical protein